MTDFKLPKLSGAELLRHAKEINPLTEVIIVTAFGTINHAVECLKAGAYDYIQKPIDLVKLTKIIDNIQFKINLLEENTILRSKLSEKFSFKNILTQNDQMQKIMSTAAKVANTNVPVLILGESGTGKELIARAIHHSSQRADKPFVVINCAALPESLFESEFFGYEKGAFTGAEKQRIGRFEEANHGTLFIDEVGDIPLSIQVKLLRTVQFGEVQKIGSNKIFKADVRIITATNKNLQQMIKEGKFREDLFYRLNVVTLNLPPLRQRKEDIVPLTTYFLQRYSKIYNLPLKKISREAMQKLMYHDYPGNIRELENIIQRALILSRSEIISDKDIQIDTENYLSAL
ncbi:MAG: sigma-54-dependent transcriptional regulator [Candidatus Kapaibacteriales bacterium]